MKSDLADTLALIAAQAPRLREAGLQSLTVGEISMVLLPPDPPPLDIAADDDADQCVNLLEDPEVYGLADGAEVPGFRRPDDLPRQ